MTRTFSIPSNGSETVSPLGVFKYLAVRSADVPFQISFDGWRWENARQNDRFDVSSQFPPHEKVYLKALNGLAAAVTLDWDTKPLGTQDTAQSSVSTSALGCGGSGIAITLQKAIAVGGADYNYNGGNRVDLTVPNSVLLIPGVRDGKKRKTIYFDNRNSGGADCIVFDATGNLWLYLRTALDTPVFETSSDFYVAGRAGICPNFTYCETFYDLANT